MKIHLKGLLPEQIILQCSKEAGLVFENFGGKYENMIQIKANGSVLINGVEEIAPELVGLAIMQWSQSFSRVINK